MSRKHSYGLQEHKENQPFGKVDNELESHEKKTNDYDVAEWNGNIDIKKFGRWIFTAFLAVIPWLLVMFFLMN